MSNHSRTLFVLLALLLSVIEATALDRFVSLSGAHVSPFTDWSTAATNIQDAVDISSDGDTVWVTNGVYASGGKVMSGDLTNRVAIDKAITVQSVNGPFITIIKGRGASNGTGAVRCAWLTNSAVLHGFTIRDGATRSAGAINLKAGGGVWCESLTARVENCLIISNASYSYGAGAHGGTLLNSLITGSVLSYPVGAATVSNTLYNCTITTNNTVGAQWANLTNCIIRWNQGDSSLGGSYIGWCCVQQYPGPGNILFKDPLLLQDGIHLGEASPCRYAGTNFTFGTDIYGRPWSSPPSMGCAEWNPVPMLFGPPSIQLSGDPIGFSIGIRVIGPAPYTCWWLRNGVPLPDSPRYSGLQSTNLTVTAVAEQDAGAYSVIVSNTFDHATSTVTNLVLHYVDAANQNPQPPFLDWSSAATNIQDAINAAMPSEIVMVSDGVYSDGGKVMDGDLTNRVAIYKPLLVQSVNGRSRTVIQGRWDPSATNGPRPLHCGPAAVRCVWMTNGAILNGFTLYSGATRAGGIDALVYGGGILGYSTNAVVANCLVLSNAAGLNGGGVEKATVLSSTIEANLAFQYAGGVADSQLRNCILRGNRAYSTGGGAYSSVLRNSFLFDNSVDRLVGGAASGCTLCNCTVISNAPPAVVSCAVTNSIVYWNFARDSSSSTFGFSCTSPLQPGPGNISADPQLLSDNQHLRSASPGIGAGSFDATIGTDLDGQPWVNPPSMGCDEPALHPMFVGAPGAYMDGFPPRLRLFISWPAGQEPFSFQWYKNGRPVNDDGVQYIGSQTTNLLVVALRPADTGNYQILSSNAFGISTSSVLPIVIHCADVASTNPVAPYTNWQTAAARIQDSLDASSSGEFVLVTNGVYSSGGAAVYPGMTNRIAVTKALQVTSMNGAKTTTILGAWDPLTTNGPLAVRCAWLTNGAILSGFTLCSGATVTNGDVTAAQCGGAVYYQSIYPASETANTVAKIMDCLVCSNSANYGGGGGYRGRYDRCWFVGNTAGQYGGGTYEGYIYSSAITDNQATNGGGCYRSRLRNCSVLRNFAQSIGGGVHSLEAYSSIIYFNSIGDVSAGSRFNHYGLSGVFNCTIPIMPEMPNSTTADPELLDGWHIAVTSPCRGAGPTNVFSEFDLDGEPWNVPPAIGCDEPYESSITGALSVSVLSDRSIAVVGQTIHFTGVLAGRASRVEWDFGDTTSLTNHSFLAVAHSYTNPGDYVVTFKAHNADYPAGVTARVNLSVVPLLAPILSGSALTGNTFTVEFITQNGVSYALEGCTNLAAGFWQSISTADGAGTPLRLLDVNPTNEAQFYRVRAYAW